MFYFSKMIFLEKLFREQISPLGGYPRLGTIRVGITRHPLPFPRPQTRGKWRKVGVTRKVGSLVQARLSGSCGSPLACCKTRSI